VTFWCSSRPCTAARRVDGAHVQRQVVEVEVRRLRGTGASCRFVDAVREVEAPVLVEEEALALDEDGLDEDVELGPS